MLKTTKVEISERSNVGSFDIQFRDYEDDSNQAFLRCEMYVEKDLLVCRNLGDNHYGAAYVIRDELPLAISRAVMSGELNLYKDEDTSKKITIEVRGLRVENLILDMMLYAGTFSWRAVAQKTRYAPEEVHRCENPYKWEIAYVTSCPLTCRPLTKG